MNNFSLTILMPCLNEELTLPYCISKAKKFLKENKIKGEVLIADNGSTDNSIKVAKNLGARVVCVREKGYGSALNAGILNSKSDYIIMGDADDSYDFSKLSEFINKFNNGYEFVIGDRFSGGIKKGAMPFLNRYLGNPLLSFIGNLLFKTGIRDFHCGLRGIKKTVYRKIDLRTTGMEFASEMVIKSSLLNLKIAQVPIVLYKDKRDRKPHLRPLRDGWRHLRFMLIYSPKFLFFLPSKLFFILGLFFCMMRLNKEYIYDFINIKLGLLTSITSIVFFVFSYLFLLSGIFIIKYGQQIDLNLMPANKSLNKILHLNLEYSLVVFFIFFIFFIFFLMKLMYSWSINDYSYLNIVENELNISGFVLSLFFSFSSLIYSFFISALNLPIRRKR